MLRDYKKNSNSSQPKRWVSPTDTITYPQPLNTRLMKRVLVVLAVIALLITGFFVVFHRGGPQITVTRYGRLADDFTGRGLLVKSEQVFYAPFEGKVTLRAEDGARCPNGRPVLTIENTTKDGQTEKKTFYSRKSGLVSFTVDGLENTLKPDIISNLNHNYRDFRGKNISVKDGDVVNAGRPLFKIVNNFSLYLMVETPADRISRYRLEDKLWVTFDNMTVVGYVKKIYGNMNLLVIILERFPDDLVNQRWVDVTVMTDAFHGVILPRQCITEKDGRVGVYRYIESAIVFWPVKVEGGTATDVVVDGVDRGVEVLTDPTKDIIKYAKKVKNTKDNDTTSADETSNPKDAPGMKNASDGKAAPNIKEAGSTENLSNKGGK